MKIKELKISMSEIVPTGEFKNVRPHMEITWEAESGEDMDFEVAQKTLKDRFYAWLPDIINKAEHKEKKEQEAKEVKERCPIHNIAWEREGVGKNNKPYAYHKLADGTTCWRRN